MLVVFPSDWPNHPLTSKSLALNCLRAFWADFFPSFTFYTFVFVPVDKCMHGASTLQNQEQTYIFPFNDYFIVDCPFAALFAHYNESKTWRQQITL